MDEHDDPQWIRVLAFAIGAAVAAFGSVGLPIVCGGSAVATGDLVIGDRDGVVVVPRARLAETLANLGQVKTAEAAMLERVRGGLRELPVAPAARRPESRT